MPLSSMLLEGLAESGDIGGWQERQAKHQSALLDLQEKQRAIADAQKLRELYASGNAPAMNEVMAIDPRFGAEMQKFNNEQLLQQFNMLKAQGDIQETKRKTQEAKQHTFANTLGLLVENWQESLGGRQPTPQDIESFKGRLGGALKFLDEAYNYKPDVPLDPYDPAHILDTAESLGYASRRAKTAQESQLRNLPPAWTAEQYRGSPPKVERNPITQQPEMLPGSPGLRGGGQRVPAGSIYDQSTGEPIAPTPENLPKLEKLYNEVSDPNEKNILGSVINGIKMSNVPVAGTTNIPEFKGQVAKAEKTAQITAEEEAADRKAIDAYFRGRPPEEVRDLIRSSIEGDVESGVRRLGQAIGVSVPGGSASATLDAIQQNLLENKPFSPGSQSNVEYEARLKAVGDPGSNKPIKDRLAALDEFYRDREAFVAQKYEPKSVEDILDRRKEGYISEETAKKLFKKFKAKKSGAL